MIDYAKRLQSVQEAMAQAVIVVVRAAGGEALTGGFKRLHVVD